MLPHSRIRRPSRVSRHRMDRRTRGRASGIGLWSAHARATTAATDARTKRRTVGVSRRPVPSCAVILHPERRHRQCPTPKAVTSGSQNRHGGAGPPNVPRNPQTMPRGAPDPPTAPHAGAPCRRPQTASAAGGTWKTSTLPLSVTRGKLRNAPKRAAVHGTAKAGNSTSERHLMPAAAARRRYRWRVHESTPTACHPPTSRASSITRNTFRPRRSP